MPQSTSFETLRHMNGARENACMLKTVPLALAVWRSVPNMLFVVGCYFNCFFDAGFKVRVFMDVV